MQRKEITNNEFKCEDLQGILTTSSECKDYMPNDARVTSVGELRERCLQTCCRTLRLPKGQN